MKVTKLEKHSVIKFIQPYLISYITKCGPENKKDVNPSSSEREAFELIFGLSNITECIDQLYYSVELLAGFRKDIGHKLMNRHDYIVYSTDQGVKSLLDSCC